MYICSITNTVTDTPVLSLKSNRIFDKLTLTNYIDKFGKDPINNELMNIDDIIEISIPEINQNNQNEITNVSSVPSLLKSFQSIWDNLSIELFQLRKELDITKKELSLSLYRQDAAVNVAVNACKERDDAIHALEQFMKDSGNSQNDVVNNAVKETEKETEIEIDNDNEVDNVDEDWLPISEKLNEEQIKLVEEHKTTNKSLRGKSPIYSLVQENENNDESHNLSTSTDFIDTLKVGEKGSLTTIKQNQKGDSAVLVYSENYFQLISLSNTSLEPLSEIHTSAKGKSKKTVFWMNETPYVLNFPAQRKNAKADSNNVQLINIQSKEKTGFRLNSENLKDITSVIGHPSINLFIVAFKDHLEFVYDLKSVFIQQLSSNINSIHLHPDGMLLGISYIDGKEIDIYDLSERQFKLKIDWGVENLIDFEFAINGYLMIIVVEGKAMVFDLRKNTVTLESNVDTSRFNGIFIDEGVSLIVCSSHYVILDPKGKSIVSSGAINTSSQVLSLHTDFENGKIQTIMATDGDSGDVVLTNFI